MTQYVGRFAPSPTGLLHAGSLVAALASWVDARHQNGRWLLRIEDIDPPREVAGASQAILSSLEAHGLFWDGDVHYQSQRYSHYEHALQTLREKQLLYACQCTRKQLRSLAHEGATAYPGFCTNLGLPENNNALRVRVSHSEIRFTDLNYGPQREQVTSTTGDFIVRRRGPLYAYQLAVVVDDSLQGVTHIVRGSDLLDNTARQIELQQKLDYSTPAYLHLPILYSTEGRKLSKQTGAQGIDNNNSVHNLRTAWNFLGQRPIDGVNSPAEFLERAVKQWQRSLIPTDAAVGST